ncbi:MAG TPA: amidohydrolase, partial [Candidatus Tectomicrobia bacterium]
LHQHPELAFQEQRTAETGYAWLQNLGLEVQPGIAGTYGLVATLDSGRPGPTLLIRADMDALPITEETGAVYASQTTGVMHACGHDAHVACVLGAAKLLVEQRQVLRGRLQFLLQPAEEKPPGGAKVLIEQGQVLQGVDAALALHVYPPLPVGQIGLRPGVLLGYSDRFTVRIHGVGGHAARPHQTVDAVAVAVQVYQALQYLVSRENDPLHPFVITIGALHAGTVANVIPNEATLLGTVRSLDPEVHQGLPERLERVVAGVCQATRARYTFEFVRGYPAMVNDEAFTRQAMASVTALLGEPAIAHLPTPQLGGEDFAFFAQRVPSLMFRLGVRNEAKGIVHAVHSSRFDLDEDALPIGAAALARVAMDYLR